MFLYCSIVIRIAGSFAELFVAILGEFHLLLLFQELFHEIPTDFVHQNEVKHCQFAVHFVGQFRDGTEYFVVIHEVLLELFIVVAKIITAVIIVIVSLF